MIFRKIPDYLLAAFLFLLPWQTRFIYESASLNGSFWEYGSKSLYGTELLLGVTVLFGMLRLVREKKSWAMPLSRKTFLALTLGGVGVLALAIGLGENAGISYQFVTWLLLAAAAGTLIVTSTLCRAALLTALLSGGVVQGILALQQFFTQQVIANKWFGLASHSAGELGASVIEFGAERWLRAYGSFGSPNSLGIYLAVLLVAGIVLYLKSEDRKLKILLISAEIVMLGGLIVSFSRGAWIAALSGAAVVGALASQRERKEFLQHLALCGGTIVFFLIIVGPLFLARFTTTNRLEARSINERTSQMTEALSVIKEQPFLGVGPGAYTVLLNSRYPSAPAYELQPVHNIYFLILAEWGLPLGLLFAVFYLALFKKVWEVKTLYLGVITVLAVAGLFDHWLYSLFTGQLVWCVIWGLVIKKE